MNAKAAPGAPSRGATSPLDGAMLDLTDEEFREISSLVYRTAGINLTEKKRALVRGRLNSLLRASSHRSFTEYLAAVQADPTGAALSALIDRISTNHSAFFREPSHFDFLTESILTPLVEGGKKPQELRIWSAGCAAGEEPYTLAMLLHERWGSQISRAGPVVLATDVSTRVLAQAAGGSYAAQRMEGIPQKYLRYFRKTDAQTYEVVPEIRPIVLFKRLNLMRDTYPLRGTFDAIFCRNVMIYFDQPTRVALVGRFHRYLNPGGHLFIGHSETLGRDSSLFSYVRPTVYRK
jgi:chemotaxis protein methyltransferase CheR